VEAEFFGPVFVDRLYRVVAAVAAALLLITAL
jgi:hypothetical protein